MKQVFVGCVMAICTAGAIFAICLLSGCTVSPEPMLETSAIQSEKFTAGQLIRTKLGRKHGQIKSVNVDHTYSVRLMDDEGRIYLQVLERFELEKE